MEKLVIKYYWAVDYHSDGYETIPVLYRNKIALQCHILDLVKEAKKMEFPKIKILGHEVIGIFSMSDIEYFEKQIDTMVMTVDEWFRKEKLDELGA